MKSSWRLVLVASLLTAAAVPASAHPVAIDTSVSCPTGITNGGFTDIGGLEATTQTAINCLKASGITEGTTGTTFTPDGTVARWQMALFLVRQAAEHQISTPSPSTEGYKDISGLSQAAQDAINQVSQLGISEGTGPSTFSPNDPVTRWQMALFLRRLAGLAGVSVPDDPAHNQFSDIESYSSEIQAAINFLADSHIALGTEGPLFSGNDAVLRWQMALFLVRILAVDVPMKAPTTLVTITPMDSVERAIGDARDFTAHLFNANGSPYTGSIGLALFAVSGGAIKWDGIPAASATFESVSDGLVISGNVAEGLAGADGVVTFRIRHQGVAPESLVAIAWQDSNDDNDPEITGSNPPLEPFAVGGTTDFVAGILPNCGGPGNGFAPISGVNTVANRIEVFGFCSVYFDGNDLFSIEGVATTMAAFEAALSPGDEITGNPYDDNPSNQSVFDLSIDNPPGTVIVAMTSAFNNTGTLGLLDLDDVIILDFSEDVAGVGPGATVEITDADGTSTTITCGIDAACGTGPADQLLITITGALTTSGGSSPDIENQALVTAIGGVLAADDGTPVDAADSSSLGRTFSGF